MKKSIIIPVLLSLIFILVACTKVNNFTQTDLKNETTTSYNELYAIAEQTLTNEYGYSLQDFNSIEYTYNDAEKQYIVTCLPSEDTLGGDVIIYINAIDMSVKSVEFGE